MTLVYVGTQADGIHAADLDEATGSLSTLGIAAMIERPTWVLADPARSLLFAVSEVGNAGDRQGEVASFAVDRPAAALRELSRVGSGGGGPTHLALDRSGSTLFVANFGGGQAAALAIDADGRLSSARPSAAHHGAGPHRRQRDPHPHGVTLDPSGTILLVPDMGTDEVYLHRRDGSGFAPASSSIRLPAGSGPRHLVFGADGRFAYLLSELSAELFVFGWDAADGRLLPVTQISLDPPGADGPPSAAALTMARDGRHLYASNRRSGAIHVFAIDATSGLPSERQVLEAGGAKPWAIEISPSGRWLLTAAQGSDRLIVLKRGDDALLAWTEVAIEVPSPTGIACFATGDTVRA